MMTANTLVSEDLWQAIRPLLPPELPKPKGGRPRVPDRADLVRFDSSPRVEHSGGSGRGRAKRG
jgi:transposase